MFGWGDKFDYFECASCGCLQIAEIPRDLGRFYPKNYYSFRVMPAPQSGLKARMAAMRDRSAATGTGFAGRWLGRWVPAQVDMTSLHLLSLRRDSAILDVGCGRGELLSRLHRAGFSDLTGVDPYIAADITVLPGLIVYRKQLREVERRFDAIMLHHVFEHVPDPAQTLSDCDARLNPGGEILLRIPTVDSYAWEKYRENWVQLDAPRHLFLHSRKSIERLAAMAGLEIKTIECDSSAFQFWASDGYLNGMSLVVQESDPARRSSPKALAEYEKLAAKLNREGRGDQICIVLRRKSAN